MFVNKQKLVAARSVRERERRAVNIEMWGEAACRARRVTRRLSIARAAAASHFVSVYPQNKK